MAIPQSFLDLLNERTDIVDVVGRYVTLKKGGANLLGLCPFHEEKSPSFTVSPGKQFYHCFGCGKHGNAIGFLMDYTGVGFLDAVKDLSRQAGLQVPEDDLTPAQAAERQQRRQQQKSLIELNAQAATAYKERLKKSTEAIAYLKGRGVSGEAAARFQLGYAPAGEHALSSVFSDYADPALEDAGLVIFKPETGRRYDRFRDRLMFPIRNLKGETIGFGGRLMGDGQPKYLNSPETPVFHKGRELYGLFEARKAIHGKGYALVCEGYMDVVALAQWGFANAVATLGTACSEQHVQLLFRHTDQIVFAFDGDTAGRKAAARALECALPQVSDTRSIRFLFLPKEHDPDSFIRERGEAAFTEQVELAITLSQYLLQVASQGCTLATPEGRARMAHQARALWQALPESALKLQILGEIARISQLDRQDLLALWQTSGEPQRHGASAAPAPRNATRVPQEQDPAAPPRDWPDYDYIDAPPAYGEPEPYFETPGTAGPDAWSAPEPLHAGSQRRSGTRLSAGGRNPARSGQQAPLRQRPLRREEHAACILLAHMTLLEDLTEQDVTLLRRLPEPDCRLFAWIDDYHQLHGVQNWQDLAPAFKQASDAFIPRLLPHIEQIASLSANNYRDEFKNAMRQIMIRCLTLEIDEVTQRYEHDSQAAARLLQLTRHLAKLK